MNKEEEQKEITAFLKSYGVRTLHSYQCIRCGNIFSDHYTIVEHIKFCKKWLGGK